jgi:hypothetical protein
MTTTKDESHLQILAIFHYVLGGMAALVSSLFLLHFFAGVAILSGAFEGHGGKDEMPRAFGLLFMALGAAAVLTGWTLGACMVVAGRSLTRHKRYTFCFVIAALMCVLCNPLGPILGVFTIVVLMRPEVKALFQARVAQVESSRLG